MIQLLKRINIPHVFIFLSAIILFSVILTYIIPSGSYDRTKKKFGKIERTLVVPGTFKELPKHFSVKGVILGDEQEGKATPVSILGLFTSIPKGMNQAASLIFFVFIIGAVFNIIQHTGAINAIMYRLLNKFRNSPTLLSAIIFSAVAFGATFLGMGAEFIPLIPLFLLISKELGYDRMYGISLFLLAEGLGWSTAITNPFNVQIAQQLAEVPIGSGMVFRIILFTICFLIGFIYLRRYGERVKADPSKSILPEEPTSITNKNELESVPLKKQHIWILITAIGLFSLILFAVQTMGWGLIEMTGGFFLVGVCTILISGMSGDEAMKAFIKGLELMIVPALIVGFARGIQVVMFEGQIIDTILHYTSTLLETLPNIWAAEGMFVFQSFLNFFIPSASGQALVSMPLMVPLGDLLDLSRQTTVFIYVLGDGFSNQVIPTNGFLMAVLGIAGIPFEKWLKFIFPVFVVFVAISAIFIAIAVMIRY